MKKITSLLILQVLCSYTSKLTTILNYRLITSLMNFAPTKLGRYIGKNELVTLNQGQIQGGGGPGVPDPPPLYLSNMFG